MFQHVVNLLQEVVLYEVLGATVSKKLRAQSCSDVSSVAVRFDVDENRSARGSTLDPLLVTTRSRFVAHMLKNRIKLGTTLFKQWRAQRGDCS